MSRSSDARLNRRITDSVDDANDAVAEPQNAGDQRKPKRQSAGPLTEKNVLKKPRASVHRDGTNGRRAHQSTTSVVPPSLDVVQRLMKLPPAKRHSASTLFDSLMDELEKENVGSASGYAVPAVNTCGEEQKLSNPKKVHPMKSPSVVHRSKGPKIGGLKATESAASNRSAVVAIAAENCNVASPNNVEKKPYEPTEELVPATPPPPQTVLHRGYELKKSRVFFENDVPKLYWQCTLEKCYGMSVSEIGAPELVEFHAHNHKPGESSL